MVKRVIVCLISLLLVVNLYSQQIFSLEEYRERALEANKDILISKEKIKVAGELRKAAYTQFIGNLSANGAYLWNQKDISLLKESALLPVGVVSATGFNLKGNEFAYLPKEAMEFDINNVFAGGISFTQPLFMGNKIRELYKISKINEKIADLDYTEQLQKVTVEVDEAYWRCISLINKEKLALSLVELLSKLNKNVEEMVNEGVATKGDLLNVRVKLNEANLALTKAKNGLALSKMALYELCGLELDGNYGLADADIEQLPMEEISPYDMERVLNSRVELKKLEQLSNVAKSNINIMKSRFMPNLALSANYIVSNPNSFNGFENKFAGMFNGGVVLNIPIFHFGDRVHTLRAAKYQAKIVDYQISKAEELIRLQVTQSHFKTVEANKKLESAISNIEAANENLKLAEEGYKEGVIGVTDLLGAQAAWVSANSDRIDAAIDVRLCLLYLMRAKGESVVDNKKIINI